MVIKVKDDDKFSDLGVLHKLDVNKNVPSSDTISTLYDDDINDVKEINDDKSLSKLNCKESVVNNQFKLNIKLLSKITSYTPESDLREAKGEVNRETATTSGSDDITSKITKSVSSLFRLVDNTSTVGLADSSPPEVVPLAVEASSNYLSLKSKATPGDRGRSDGVIKPVSDLWELEGGLNKGAVCKTKTGKSGKPKAEVKNIRVAGIFTSRDRCEDEGKDVTSGGIPVGDLWELEGQLNRRGSTPSGKTSGGSVRLDIVDWTYDVCNLKDEYAIGGVCETAYSGADLRWYGESDRDRASGTIDDAMLYNENVYKGCESYWYRPFSISGGRLCKLNGIPVVECVVGNVQKSWHLEAIKLLSRNIYSMYKLIMLRLSNSRYNIHPKNLLIYCKNGWKVIQDGSFGTVYVGLVEGMGYCAVKIPNKYMIYNDGIGVMKRFINEWDILSKCNHNNIIKLYGGIILGIYDIWLCTELVNGIDLHTVKYGGSRGVRHIPIKYSLKMCRQLANAIYYLHTPNVNKGIIIHRDIKPENIIVDINYNIKLCDFGDAQETKNGVLNTISGATWLYAPPELLLFDSNKTILNEKWDIWSMGCVFIEMFGFPGPFHHLVNTNDPPHIVCEKMIKNAKKGLVPNIPKLLYNKRIGKLIIQCLNNNPIKRPNALQICKILSNPDVLLMQ